MFKNFGLIVLFFIYTLNAQNDSIYLIKSGAIVHQEAINMIDSIVFIRLADNQFGTFTDPRDNHSYPTVAIGSQVWMATNLAYLPSVNGPNIRSETIPYYYVATYSGTDPLSAKNNINYSKFGVLYNFAAAINACPVGWHLPDTSEYSILINYIGDWTIAGGKLKETGFTNWNSPNLAATNESGFSARGGGYYKAQTGEFIHQGKYGYYWSSTVESFIIPYCYIFHFNAPFVNQSQYFKENGLSVRCIQNN